MGTTQAKTLDGNWEQISVIGESVTIILQNQWEALIHYGTTSPPTDTPDVVTLSAKRYSLAINSTTSPVWARAQSGNGALISILKD